MSRAARLKSTITVAAVFAMVSGSFFIRANLPQLPGRVSWLWWPLFVLSGFVASYGATWLWYLFVRFEYVRKRILGRTWIEGFWLLETTEYDENGQEVVQRGIAQYSCDRSNLALGATFNNLRLPSNEYFFVGPTSLMLDDKLEYVNYFKKTAAGIEIAGVAVGHFARNINGPTDRYTGIISYLAEAENRNRIGQKGWKISKRQVTTFRNRFGDHWQEHVLRDSALCDEICGRNIIVKQALTAAG